MHLGRQSLLIGDQRNTILLNQMIIIAKYEIYKKKWNGNTLNIYTLTNVFKKQMESENYTAKISDRMDVFLGKWSPVYYCLR